ncbi:MULTISPECIES: H-NS histone family protein [unclassified Halorhodospira]|uniref:H-NS histone family protein n=1 Tax=unclassified Halorhodospira TaxID=2626748 RepID=UPI001EE94B42|nr:MULTISPECIES: H-NS histone family protein [unclassified Halorhodospira]MCG5540212.1 H-NS histone family protein [Halorhodospira sp. M39old]MCG5545087.1 H-NS histone family protein [Halorhodospira sp. M38]
MTSKQLEAINLEGFTDEELDTLEKRIAREREQRDRNRVVQAEKEIRLVAAKYGVKLEEALGDINGHSTKPRRRVPAKYRHPRDPAKTWSGRGRTPRWIQEWEQDGGSREELRIAH